MYHILQKPLPIKTPSQVATTPIASGLKLAANVNASMLKSEPEKTPSAPEPCLHHLYYRKCLLQRKQKPEVGKLLKATAKPEFENIAIVGAGMSGLFAGYLLKKYSPQVKFEIIEADSRVGGRILTHYFDKDPSKYQYGEFGAMRLPKNHVIVRQLITQLNKEVDEDKKLELIKFYFSNDETLLHFNGKKIKKSLYKDSEQLGFSFNPNRPTADQLLAEHFQPLIDIATGVPNGIEILKKLFDGHTVRSYLRQFLSPEEIDYISTVESATGLYDLSLIESILDVITFNATEWETIDQGMSRFPEALASLVKDHIKLSTPVRGISHNGNKVKLTFKHGEPKEYDAVLITVPFGSLRFWDLPDDWTYLKRRAIRELHYDSSTKILLQYQNAFWLDVHSVGGSSSTDKPVRTVVYPSFPPKDQSSQKQAVLLSSYTWGLDASRLAGLDKEEAIAVAKRDIKQLYGHQPDEHNAINAELHAWSTNNFTNGAFALYGPGQFEELYQGASCPEKGTVFFAGEHLSPQHAWIEGSLESTLDALEEMLPVAQSRAMRKVFNDPKDMI